MGTDVTFKEEPEARPEVVRAILYNLPTSMPPIPRSILPTLREEISVQVKHLFKEHDEEMDSKRHSSVSL